MDRASQDGPDRQRSSILRSTTDPAMAHRLDGRMGGAASWDDPGCVVWVVSVHAVPVLCTSWTDRIVEIAPVVKKSHPSRKKTGRGAIKGG